MAASSSLDALAARNDAGGLLDVLVLAERGRRRYASGR
jgi:hypothetical protein